MDDSQIQDNNSDAQTEDNQMPVGGLGTPPTDNSYTPADEQPANQDHFGPSDSQDSTSSDNTDDLMDIKKQAITQLTPLVKHLDQSPEERFRTTLMMIQATDNRALIQDAYDAAEQIQDDKLKAEALLDIVNEINYFTRPTDL